MRNIVNFALEFIMAQKLHVCWVDVDEAPKCV